jgi:acyl phosphate:glycerol-3-phosphate acyltransferase
MQDVIWAIIGYLCGSIPFGLIFTRAAGLGDVRNIGSGNIGATNVLRTGNRKIAAATLLCDGLKGTLPVLLAQFYGGEWPGIITGLAALAGHIFPVWLGFKGGKGVATGLGVIFAWSWPLGLFVCAAWLVIFKLSHYSSASALGAYGLVVVASLAGQQPLQISAAIFVVALVVWLTHHENIRRLASGSETKSSFAKKP